MSCNEQQILGLSSLSEKVYLLDRLYCRLSEEISSGKDHGNLTGLNDDDHPQYALANGYRWTTVQNQDRVVISDTNGYLVTSAVTSTELSYLNGLTENVQAGLDEGKPAGTLGEVQLKGSVGFDVVPNVGFKWDNIAQKLDISKQTILDGSAELTLVDNFDFESANLAPDFSVSGSVLPTIAADSVNTGTYSVKFTCGDLQDSILTTTYTALQNSIITFSFRTDTEENYDFFKFYIDDVNQVSYSGSIPWMTSGRFFLKAGIHELKWRLHRDTASGTAINTVWLDTINVSSYVPSVEFSDLVDFNSEINFNNSVNFNEKISGKPRFSGDIYVDRIRISSEGGDLNTLVGRDRQRFTNVLGRNTVFGYGFDGGESIDTDVYGTSVFGFSGEPELSSNSIFVGSSANKGVEITGSNNVSIVPNYFGAFVFNDVLVGASDSHTLVLGTSGLSQDWALFKKDDVTAVLSPTQSTSKLNADTTGKGVVIVEYLNDRLSNFDFVDSNNSSLISDIFPNPNSITNSVNLGSQSINTSSTGDRITSIGAYAMGFNSADQSYNTAIGWGSLRNIAGGKGNVVAGINAAKGLTTGNNNIVLISNDSFSGDGSVVFAPFNTNKPDPSSSNNIILSNDADNFVFWSKPSYELLLPQLTIPLIQSAGNKSAVNKEYVDTKVSTDIAAAIPSPSFANSYIETAILVPVAALNTYYKVTVTGWLDIMLADFTQVDGTFTYTGTQTKVLRVSYNVQSSSSGTRTKVAIGKNGVPLYVASSLMYSTPVSQLVSFSTGDYIELFTKVTGSTLADFTATAISVVID